MTSRDSRTWTSQGRAILRCRNKDCKKVGSRAFTTTTTQWAYEGRMESSVTVTPEGGRERGGQFQGDTQKALHAPCPACGSNSVTVSIVRGTVNESRTCDERCLSARRASCECSCGGANHGVGHGSW